ncbi:hypothetical protein SNE40_000911 [Patella caerulea]|uniref:Inositol 1,4,5-trisphosphate receptor n=1 Tax=Patella caerulea TaxID=87958 RepID=A0AAN8Q2V6_PATCE
MDDTLCIGDNISLYSEDANGYVLSFQTSSVHSEIAVASKQERVRSHISNQQVKAFEVCVPNKYKQRSKYSRLLEQLKKGPDNINLKNSVAQAKITADQESEDNGSEQKKQQGRKVVYGQLIQLRHLFTGKYVHVSTKKTSNTESNNMTVELKPENAKHCRFRIMPRYKVKSEGDVVQIGDQIVLESDKSTGQFLHVSRQPFPKTSVYTQCPELNLSVIQSGFTLHRKHKRRYDDHKKIKDGDVIRFFHKEMEAYLVAEGLFDDKVVEDVHLRIRTADQNILKTLFPSSSAVTYWQIELQEGSIAGGVLKWEQRCRIIHMCARKYLTVDIDGRVTLTSDTSDPRTYFKLHAVIRDSDDIPFDSYCRMEHVVTGKWLHAGSADYKLSSQLNNEDDKSMSGLKCSKAELKEITAIKNKHYDDAFTVQSVSTKLCSIFNYVSGMVPCIQKLISDKNDEMVLKYKTTYDVITALKELNSFMIVNSYPSKNRQKLMRNLRIVDLLVDLLHIPFKDTPDQTYLTKIFVEAYAVLKTYLVGNSRKNELYIAKYIGFFLTQFTYKEAKIGLYAAHMVMELIRDNRKIVDRVSHEQIDHFIDLLNSEKNYRYLELLGVLCVCDGVSIADNQTYITKKWLIKDTEDPNEANVHKPDIGHVTRINLNGKKNEKTPDTILRYGGLLWKTSASLSAQTRSQDEPQEQEMYLEHQLELFRMLCHGQNEFTIDVITSQLQFLTWEEAFDCLKDDTIPGRLRAKYCELIITLYVDIVSNVSVIDRVRLSYNYEGIASDESTFDQSSSPTAEYFPQLRDWIAYFLGNNGDMTASEIGHNMLVKQVLRLVYYLVMYGFYNKREDMDSLLKPLMSLLDGRNDKPYPDTARGHDASQVRKNFREIGRYQKSPETRAVVDAKIQALDVLNLTFNFTFNLRMEKLIQLFKSTYDEANEYRLFQPELSALLYEGYTLENAKSSKSAVKILENIFEETELFIPDKITQILLDLSHYHYDEMVCKSMHLLNRYYSFHYKLFSHAIQAQVLITDSSVKIMKRLSIILPKLRRLATAKLSDNQALELSNILDELKTMCQLDGDVCETHKMNQTILYNHGVLEDALTILSQAIDVKLLDGYVQNLKKIFSKTFLLLQWMTKNNKVIQMRLFDRLDMLLNKEGAPIELAELLTEIFTGNSTTCMKIQGHHVQRVVTLIVKHGFEVPQFLDMLNAVVKVEELDLPMKRNQGFVMTYFMQYRSDIAQVIDQSDEARKSVLESRNTQELDYMTSMVDLLATCAEGENSFIESICQTIFKINDILDVLINKNIGDNVKKPFLRFLLWVYMNTASGMIESGAGDLPHDRKIWEFINNTTDNLKQVKLFIENNKEQTKQLLKRPPSRSPGNSYDINNLQEMHGTLHYLFDGVMEFLQLFCRSYFQQDTDFANETDQLSNLALTYVEFLDAIAPLVSDERQMKNLTATMSGLMTATNAIPEYKMEEFHVRYGARIHRNILSDAREAYNEYFAAEEEINVSLNVFVGNMKLSYGGLNTVQHQIKFPSNKEYTEVGGDEDLPLGQEFQNHLKCFVNPDTKDPILKYKLAEKLVMQLRISSNLNNLTEKERLDQTELDIKCLQLLRGLIHNELVKLPEDWQTNMKRNQKYLNAIESVQTAINSYDVILSVSTHFTSPIDSVVRELLAFMCALLFSGNDAVQKSLLASFTGTREETFFFAIKNRIQRAALATREKRLLNVQHQAKIEETINQARALQKTMKGRALLIEEDAGAMLIPDELEFKDDAYIELMLRMMGLMCDNQYTGLQDYLREQPDNIKSVNVVAEVTKFLSTLYNNIDDVSIPLITQLFDTLVEFTSGNFANQAVVFDNKICDYITHILKHDTYKGCNLEQIYTLKQSIVILLRSLTEENPPVLEDDDEDADDGDVERSTKRLKEKTSSEVFEYLEKSALTCGMVTAYQDLLSPHKEYKENAKLISYVGCKFHHLLCRRIDLRGNEDPEELYEDDHLRAAWKYFSNSTLSIEIIKDDTLQKIYFTVRDKNVLREEKKEKFKYEVDRSSPSNKLRDFMDWSSDIIDDIRYQKKIHSSVIARFLLKIWPLLNVFALILSVAIAAMILGTWKADVSGDVVVPDISDYPRVREATYILGGIHNLTSLLMLISYLLSNHPKLPRWKNIKSTIRGPKYMNMEGKIPEKQRHVNLFSFKTFYYVMFLGFSFAGTFYHGYFFSFHLLHMAKLNQLLIRVIQAVTRNGLSLISVGLLGLAVLYIHSLFAFAFFRDYLDQNEGRQCNTMFQCFITVIHHGLAEGMYTTFEQQLTNRTFAQTAAVAAFDVIFFIIITTIGLNIIFGIIVDTFSELRDSKWKIDNDMKSSCFICSRENYDFERQGNGFEHHVKKEHNQWSYLFFFIHLEDTQPNDYSALELFVNNRRLRKRLDFFPLNRALSLQYEGDKHTKKLESLKNQVDYLVQKLKTTEAKKERKLEKQRQREWEQKHVKRE